jgi:hypothetical protein
MTRMQYQQTSDLWPHRAPLFPRLSYVYDVFNDLSHVSKDDDD